MSTKYKKTLLERFRTAALWVKALILAGMGAIPMLSASLSRVYAAPVLPNREARVTTTQTGATFNITFEFDLPTGFANSIQSMEFEFCDQPLGTCTTTQTPTIPAASTVTQNGNWTNATAFGTYTRTNGDNGGTNNQIQVSRTQAANETTATTDRSISFTGLTNQSDPNESYYPRIRIYSDTGFTTLVAEGVVAQSTARQLTVNARVQERLDFCTGVSAVDDATTTLGADCAAVTANGLGNTIDIGVVDASQVCVSGPSNPCETDNTYNGVAMVRTNAFNGVVIDYFAEQNAGSGQLKVAGATCTDFFTTVTDQCFNAADSNSDYSNGANQQTFSAGTERFGMTVAGVNCGSTSAYTCDFSTGSYNLVRDTEYDGTGANTFGTSQGFAWDARGGTTGVDRIASSAGSSVKVVEDEALIMKFAATAGVTTPTGSYTVTSTYIATATF